MANDKNNNNGSVTAGDLHGKLNRIRQNADGVDTSQRETEQDPIDVTFESESDGDLNINELLQRYMADYDEEKENKAEPEGSVLDEIRKEGEGAEKLLSDEDEKLISALDSAFSLPSSKEDDDIPDLTLSDVFGGVVRYDGTDDSNRLLETEDDTEPLTFEKGYKPDWAVSVNDGKSVPEDNSVTDQLTEAFDESEAKPAGGKLKKFFGWFFAANDGEEEEEEEAYAPYDETDGLVIDRGDAVEEVNETVAEDTAVSPEEESVPDTAGEADLKEEEPTDEDELLRRAMEMLTSSSEPQSATEENQPEINEYEAAAEEVEEEIDSTDINLMVAFGMDQDGKDKTGEAKKLGDKLQAHQEAQNKKLKLDRPEFVDASQVAEIRNMYAAKERSLWIRLVICAVFSLLLLLFENVGLLTKIFTGTEKQFAGVFDPAVYPTVYVMTSLQLMLLACVCALDQIVYALKNLFHGVLRPELTLVLLTLAGIVFSVASTRVVVAPAEPITFNFVTALTAFITLVSALINTRRESMNFRVVSDKRVKHIVRRLNEGEAKGETGAFADMKDICDVMKIEKTNFVDNFFARLQRPVSVTGTTVMCILGVSVAASLLFTLFAGLRGQNGARCWQVFYESLLILSPLALTLAFAYPFYRASKIAKEYDSAIIGESSLEEYSNASIISFDDKNVFPSYSVKVQNIHICNNARIDRVFYYAASVFSYAGGPLQDVFELATQNVEISSNVQLFDIEEGFLATQVDGVNIIFGSREGLMQHGFEVTDEDAADDDYFAEELEIMYMFREDKLIAKMYMQYVMDPDIDLILKQFSGNGLYVCVRTFDPNISERMIARKLNMDKIPLRIVRYTSRDEVTVYEEKADSGLVTSGTPKSLLQIISYCGNVLHTRKTNVALNILSLLIGAAIIQLLLLTGVLGTQYSLFIALYQLIWLIPIVISTRMFVR